MLSTGALAQRCGDVVRSDARHQHAQALVAGLLDRDGIDDPARTARRSGRDSDAQLIEVLGDRAGWPLPDRGGRGAARGSPRSRRYRRRGSGSWRRSRPGSPASSRAMSSFCWLPPESCRTRARRFGVLTSCSAIRRSAKAPIALRIEERTLRERRLPVVAQDGVGLDIDAAGQAGREPVFRDMGDAGRGDRRGREPVVIAAADATDLAAVAGRRPVMPRPTRAGRFRPRRRCRGSRRRGPRGDDPLTACRPRSLTTQRSRTVRAIDRCRDAASVDRATSRPARGRPSSGPARGDRSLAGVDRADGLRRGAAP